MQAIIRTGGKQYLVHPNQTLDVELIHTEGEQAKRLEFEPLLVIDGDKIQVGQPNVKGVAVKAELVGEAKGEKIRVLKFKAKKRVKKLTGHRQHYSQIKITSIG